MFEIIIYNNQKYPFSYTHFGSINSLTSWGEHGPFSESSTGLGMVNMINKFMERANIDNIEEIEANLLKIEEIIPTLKFKPILYEIEEKFMSDLECFTEDFDFEQEDEKIKKDLREIKEKIKADYNEPFVKYKELIDDKILERFEKIFK